jgi:hypothetical protein
MSERHLQWLMMMTGPRAAAARSLSKEGKEGLKAWQSLYLGNKLVTFAQKLSLLHDEMTQWIHPHAILSTIAFAIRCNFQCENFEVLIDCFELVCQMRVCRADLID